MSRYSIYIVALVFLVPSTLSAQGTTNPGRAAQKQKRVTKPPKLVKSVEAEYSEQAREMRIQGTVKLRLTLDKKGKVKKIEVLDGLGYGLDKAAKEAVKKFEFEPAEVNGELASVRLPFKIRFSLPPKPANVTGTIVGRSTGEPLAGAEIRIEYTGDEYEEPPNSTVQTGKDGEFEFSEVPPGSYRLTVRLDEYLSRSFEIDLEAGETAQLNFALSKTPVVFRGTVLQAGDRTVLPGVRVTVSDPDDKLETKSTRTDKNGKFRVRGLPAGRYRIKIDADGYETFRSTEKIKKKRILQTTYYLKPEYADEYSVTTTAKKETKSLERDKISLEEVRKIPGTGGDVVRAVQNLPGVARPSFSSGNIVVRGADPESTKTFLDGDEIPNIYHFFGGPAVINSEMIEEVNFYPGNFSARYGRALGGVIDLETRSPRTDGYHGFAEFDLLDGTFQLEGPITEDLSFAVSGRRSYIGQVIPAVVPEDTFETTVAPRYYDFQGWLNWDPDPDHDLELSVYGSSDKVELLFDEDDPQGNTDVQITGLNFGNSFYRGQLKWDWRPSKKLENDMMVSAGVNNVKFKGGPDFIFDLEFQQLQFRNDLSWDITDDLEWRAGLDIQAGITNYSFDIGSSGPGSPNFDPRGLVGDRESPVYRPAVYTDITKTFFDRLEITPSFRLDYFGRIDAWSPSPRGNAEFEITEDITAKAGVGLFSQPPNPGQTAPNFGNPNLTYQKALHYSGGTTWKPKEFLELDATVFYRDLYDQVRQTDRRRQSDNGENVENQIYDNRGEGRSYGLELLARHYPANQFFGWVAYTLSRSERFDPDENEYTPFQYDQTHNLTAVAGYNLPWNIDISAKFQLVSGNPYTPVVGSVYDADTGQYEPIQGPRNSKRSKVFHQLDFRIDKTWIFNTWELGVYLDIINIYNRQNQEGVQYNYDYSESAPVNGLPIIPTLGVNGRF